MLSYNFSNSAFLQLCFKPFVQLGLFQKVYHPPLRITRLTVTVELYVELSLPLGQKPSDISCTPIFLTRDRQVNLCATWSKPQSKTARHFGYMSDDFSTSYRRVKLHTILSNPNSSCPEVEIRGNLPGRSPFSCRLQCQDARWNPRASGYPSQVASYGVNQQPAISALQVTKTMRGRARH